MTTELLLFLSALSSVFFNGSRRDTFVQMIAHETVWLQSLHLPNWLTGDGEALGRLNNKNRNCGCAQKS